MIYSKPKYIICDHCGDEIYGDEHVFDFHGSNLCEDCFNSQVKKHYPDVIDDDNPKSAEEYANELTFYHTTAENKISNDYDLAMEAKEEARRDEYL